MCCTKLPPQAEVLGVGRWDSGHTSKLNSTGALQGIWNNTGLTDPTKWPIKKNLGSKKIPNPTTVSPLDQGTDKKGEGVRLACTMSWRWNCGSVFSPLVRRKLNYWEDQTSLWQEQRPLTTSKKQIEGNCQMLICVSAKKVCMRIWPCVCKTWARTLVKTPAACPHLSIQPAKWRGY